MRQWCQNADNLVLTEHGAHCVSISCVNKQYFRAGLLSALGAIVAIFFVISVSSSDTIPTKSVASNVEKVMPPPGGLQRPQAEVSFDLQDGYIGRLFIDGEVIPDDQLEKVVSLGQYTFRPGKGNVIEQFTAGTHQAQIFYWPADQPEPSSPQNYQWSFQVTS